MYIKNAEKIMLTYKEMKLLATIKFMQVNMTMQYSFTRCTHPKYFVRAPNLQNIVLLKLNFEESCRNITFKITFI